MQLIILSFWMFNFKVQTKNFFFLECLANTLTFKEAEKVI